MEDLLSSLTGVAVTPHQNSPHAEHPHFSLYKAKSTGSSQDERRKKVLAVRKEARYDLLMHLRCIEEGPSHSFERTDEGMEYEQMEKACYSRPKKYRNFLMLSEWLVDVPEDFATCFLAVPCPVGKRSLIVSARGKTRAYAKSGIMVNQFPSLLPGGNRHTASKGYALLDCIWSEINKTYYVIDLVVWLNQSIMECETLFRFEWLKSRLSEERPEVSQVSKFNPFRFERVPYYDCSPAALGRLVSDPLPFTVPLDGILFYHKESHYTHGPTPLVGWLKAYMFPEILNVPVPGEVLSQMPEKYINLPTHIQYGEEKRQEKLKAKCEKMDVSSFRNETTKKTKNKRVEDNLESQMESSAC
ncbi:LOW QUALITY PROTEIN: snurportin-1 [Panulirus ornatus]|uniref:LOW QUALITY PROTEIN: snurportin-1 n=1 Tax=Panulirus ornatus TaxID=150431 RepID=UPI003A89D0F0